MSREDKFGPVRMPDPPDMVEVPLLMRPFFYCSLFTSPSFVTRRVLRIRVAIVVGAIILIPLYIMAARYFHSD